MVKEVDSKNYLSLMDGTKFEIKPLTKTDYLFGMIKRAFGYE